MQKVMEMAFVMDSDCEKQVEQMIQCAYSMLLPFDVPIFCKKKKIFGELWRNMVCKLQTV